MIVKCLRLYNYFLTVHQRLFIDDRRHIQLHFSGVKGFTKNYLLETITSSKSNKNINPMS